VIKSLVAAFDWTIDNATAAVKSINSQPHH
jgi:hypothetical protein